MLSITLIGFNDGLADQIAGDLIARGGNVIREKSLPALRADTVGLIVSGDQPGWFVTVAKARSQRPDLRIVVATRIPDTHIWLDALDAGANDYCCVPLDRRLVEWLLGQGSAHRTASG